MSDYISREDVKKLLWERISLATFMRRGIPNAMKSLSLISEKLEKIPAADVRPVKEGYWQEGEFKYLTCSECGCDTNLYDQHGFPIGHSKGHPYPSFCPHCGADMRPDGGTTWMNC